MAYPKFKDIQQDVLVMMGQVSGSSVQTYTEPLIDLAINRIFDFLWEKQKWPHLWTWETKTLDGVTGKFTTPLSTVREWEDIAEFRVGGTERGIPMASGNEHTLGSGSSAPRHYTILPWDDADSETKFVKFWPVTSLGTVDILVGHRPDVFALPDDKIPMKKSLMVDGCVWWMLEDDGMNPASVEKARLAFDLNYQDTAGRIGARSIGHGSGRRNGGTVLIQQ
jgi:hypothetical protein